MDPASAIGTASAVISFVEFAYKFASTVYAIYKEPDAEETATIETVCKELQTLSQDIIRKPTTQSDIAVKTLALQCQKLSGAILRKIAKTQPKNRKVLSVAKAALKAVCTRDEITQLQSYLDSCSRQLQLNMIAIQSEQIGKLEEASEAFCDQLETYRERANLEALLDALSFPAMTTRYQDIVTAANDTFVWIFGKSGWPDPLDETLNKPDDDELLSLLGMETQKLTVDEPHFLEWLISGNGIFHISGKPGSGKSALMKFILDCPETEIALSAWAGDKMLLQGHAFFWKPGSPMQRNLRGLRQTLMHVVLRQKPDIARVLFPQYWNPGDYGLWGTASAATISLNESEVERAFQKLISDTDIYADYRCCFFIDGLDEFDDPNKTHTDLVDDLNRWIKTSGGNVKMCVASRELPVFQERLKPVHRIRLQDLTRSDIVQVVSERLRIELADEHCFRNEQWRQLLFEIVDKANGVFLWVMLTLRLVSEALQAKESLAQILHIVDTAPQELEDFFQHILDQIPRAQRRKAAAMFLHASAANAWITQYLCTDSLFNPNGLLWYSLLDDYVENPGFLDDNSQRIQFNNISKKTLGERIRQVHGRVSSRSRGLLEFVYRVGGGIPYDRDGAKDDGSIDAVNYGRLQVQYTHRTIPEFLERQLPRCWGEFLDDTSDVMTTFLHLAIAVAASVPLAGANNHPDYEVALDVNLLCGAPCDSIMKGSDGGSSDASRTQPKSHYFVLLDILDQLLIARQLEANPDFAVLRWTKYKTSFVRDHPTIYTVMQNAVNLGCYEYLGWALQHRPAASVGTTPEDLVQLLHAAILDDHAESEALWPILRENGVSPASPLVVGDDGGRITLWQSLLSAMWGRESFNLWTLVEDFLVFGVPLPVSFQAEVLIVAGDKMKVHPFETVYPDESIINSREQLLDELNGTVTLTQFVAARNPPNAPKLLELLSEQGQAE